VVIRSADREAIARAVASYVTRLRAKHPEIQQVIWFGSWVTGIPLPGSDVDLCLILSGSDKPPRERIPEYLPVGFPVGVDLFAYTQTEFEQLKETSPGWYETITSGRKI
jgi:predicted nucleotidyltransferase